jgi:hypothetical protein
VEGAPVAPSKVDAVGFDWHRMILLLAGFFLPQLLSS